MNEKLIGHGFIPPDEIKPEEYIFGQQKLSDTIILDNGDWRRFLPVEETQRKIFETWACTVYNTINPIEILERKVFGEDSEYAERPVYIGTGTRPPGNNPHVIGEWIRKNGLAPEQILPFSDDLTSLEQYIKPNPLPVDIVWAGKEWINKKDFGHEWVFIAGDPKTKNDILKEAIRRSPIGISVVGWKEKNGIYYKGQGEKDNHWTVLVAYQDECPIIFDSYYPFIKKLEKNYDFGYAKRYWIEKKQLSFKEICEKKSKWFLIKNYFKEIIK